MRIPTSRRTIVAVFVVALGIGGVTAQEPLPVTFSAMQVTGSDARTRLEEALSRAVERANRKLEQTAFVLAESRAPDPTTRAGGIGVTAVHDDTQRLLAFSTTTRDRGEVSYTVFAPWDDVLETVIDGVLRYLHAARRGFPGTAADGPVLVDELPGSYVEAPSARYSQLGMYPYGVAVRPDGDIVVGGSTFAVETDPLFRIEGYPGSALLEQGTFNYALHVAVTPGDTVYLKGSTGAEAYRLVEGVERPQRLRVPASGTGLFTALADGSIVFVDQTNKRAVRTAGRRRSELGLHTHANAFISAVAPGNAGNLWAFDVTDRRILVVSPTGEIVDSIVPQLPQNQVAGTAAMAVYESGDFVLLTRTGLAKCTRDGRLLWLLETVPNYERSSFQTASDVAVDSGGGFVYVSDPVRRSVTRFADPTVAPLSGPHVRLAEAARSVAAGTDEVSGLRTRAALYEETGAAMMAEAAWQRVLDVDPFDAEAEQGLVRAELVRLEARADRLADETRRLLARLGPESARLAYTRALQAYERILSRHPDHSEAEAAMRSLRADFERHGLPGTSTENPLRFVELAVEDLFPSLSSAYLRRSVGHAVLENAGERELRNLEVRLEMRRFGDYPVSSEPVPVLAPGETVEVPLRVVLNREVFDLEEDLPVQVRAAATGYADNSTVEATRTQGITLYRRTALTWEETERLAAFVTPNEGTVARFAHALLQAGDTAPAGNTPPTFDRAPRDEPSTQGPSLERFSDRIARAAVLADGLGVYGVSYVEDPQTPISSVLGRKAVVDTVRFPRTTLLHRAGDCDDTTALLCSLYEASGISTAIVTTPDHVLLAFDTEEPASRAWLFESDETLVFRREGRVWLPVETTVLSDGFADAWTAASVRIRRAGGTREVGFVPVSRARETYPPLSLPATDLGIVAPAARRRMPVAEATKATLERMLYHAPLARAEERAAAARDDDRVRQLNRLAMLHARFGRSEAARETLRTALSEAPEALITRVNLANLAVAEGDHTTARRALEPALEQSPNSLIIHALLARIERGLGNDRVAQRHADLVIERSPSLARRYGLTAEPSGSRADGSDTDRARAGGPRAPGSDPSRFVWPTSEKEL